VHDISAFLVREERILALLAEPRKRVLPNGKLVSEIAGSDLVATARRTNAVALALRNLMVKVREESRKPARRGEGGLIAVGHTLIIQAIS